MIKLSIIIIMVFCLPIIGQSQPGIGSILIRVFNEEKNPIFFTYPDSINYIEAHYENEAAERSVTDTNTSRRTYGYSRFYGGIVNSIIIHYKHQIMTLLLTENCPPTLNGEQLIIDDVLFKEGTYSINCMSSHEEIRNNDTVQKTNVIYRPNYGFYIDFNTNFIDFPSETQSDWERADYLSENLKIVFIDSTKFTENNRSLIEQCSEKLFYETQKNISVDSTKINLKEGSVLDKLIFTYDTLAYTRIVINPPLWNNYREACYDNKYVIKDLSLSSQSKGTVYWYSGKLIFMFNGIKKEFFLKNIPDGYILDLKDIKLEKSTEYIEFTPYLGKDEVRKIDVNKYRK